MKKFWMSKTFWASLGAIIGSVGLLVTGEQHLAEWLLGAGGVMSIVLRFFTSQGISIK